MQKIIWKTTTIRKQNPFYTAERGKFKAIISYCGVCYNLQILYNAGNYAMYYYSNIASCKSQFRKFLKEWGEI